QGDVGVRTLVTIAERQVASASWATKYRTRVDRIVGLPASGRHYLFLPAIGLSRPLAGCRPALCYLRL
ncbi:hypothetical protein, partial [Stenotrophomonas pavanii]